MLLNVYHHSWVYAIHIFYILCQRQLISDNFFLLKIIIFLHFFPFLTFSLINSVLQVLLFFELRNQYHTFTFLTRPACPVTIASNLSYSPSPVYTHQQLNCCWRQIIHFYHIWIFLHWERTMCEERCFFLPFSIVLWEELLTFIPLLSY